MKIAFLYSGQGCQYTGMGREFYNEYPVFKKVYNESDVGFNIADMCFNENKTNLLNKTRYTQPCLVAYQIGVTKILNQLNIWPQITAGISLGEYTALYVAGVWEEKEILDIVKYRGQLMEESVKDIDGMTVSIIGLSSNRVEEICDRCLEIGIVGVTNYCCEGNVSIAGLKPAVIRACELAKESGAKYCIPLKSQYPFHTELLHNAGLELAGFLSSIDMKEMKIPVVFNYTGRPKTEDEQIGKLLEEQIQSAIHFQKIIKYLEDIGVDVIVEISPCDVNSKIVKRISDKIKTFSINKPEDIDELLNYMQWN